MSSCADCRFFVRQDADATYGDCRRHAPKARVDFDGLWPLVDEDKWCGEWEQEPCAATFTSGFVEAVCDLADGHDGNHSSMELLLRAYGAVVE